MVIRSLMLTVSAITTLSFLVPVSPALAGGKMGGQMGGHYSGGGQKMCMPSKPQGHGNTIITNKNYNNNNNYNKNTNINKNTNVNNNTNINKNTNVNNNKNVNNNTNTNTANAQSTANANTSSSAFASPTSNASGGSSASFVTVMSNGGDIGTIAVAQPEEQCVSQWASVVKAIHAECVDASGGHHPAVRMRPETWIDSSESAEIFRCLEGSTLKVVVGDVVQSDHGMAGIYQGGQEIACGPGEALRHFKDGLVKCAVKEKVPDCTERTNLRKYGVGDLFFTYQAQVCARSVQVSDAHGYSRPNEVELSGLSLNGGVGPGQ